MGLLLLVNEPLETVKIGLERIIGAEEGCVYLNRLEPTILSDALYQPIQNDWGHALRQCRNQQYAQIYPDAYRNELTPLQVRLDQMLGLDDLPAVENGLNPFANNAASVHDAHNRQIIDQVYEEYGTYIGLDRVGPQFASHMWAGIHSSTADYIERYLPVLRQAVLEQQLAPGQYQQTLNRYCFLTTGTHLYEWMGRPVADPAVRKRLEQQHGL